MQVNQQHGRLFSASDLVAYLGCKHRTTLDLRKLAGWDEQRVEGDGAARVVQEYGNRHELAYLATLQAAGLQVVEIDKSQSLDRQVGQTRAAMADGVDVIFQATLLQPPFLGYADFLLRVNGASTLGSYHYEVADTKLAKSNRAKFMVQLCLYADLVAAEQGLLPEHLHVVLGQLTAREKQERGLAPDAENVTKVRTRDYIHYVRAIRADFLAFAQGAVQTRPVPVTACSQCGWRDYCAVKWESADHLSRVANIRHDQIDKLESVGVTTMAALAQWDGEVKGISAPTLAKLKRQAGLQCHPIDAAGRLRIERLPARADKPTGLQLLPEASSGDLYFDMEGFPHEPGGLEYLFGVGYLEDGDSARFRFKPFWAHDRAQEKLAFEAFMDFVEQRLARYPTAHIYHYAPYEKTAIQRLSSVHDTRTELRDRLLREGRLVDLYRVVASGLLLAVPSYSIKKVEAYYRGKRQGEVANAGDSIAQYEAYRVANDLATKTKLLQDIESYNFDDVESTRQLHQWLQSLRLPDAAPFQVAAVEDAEEAARLATRNEREVRQAAAVATLNAWAARQPDAERTSARDLANVLEALLGFYWRCDLPGLWRKFQRMEQDEAELVDDPECLALLEFTGQITAQARSLRYHFTVPDQETKLYSGAQVACLTDGESAAHFEYDREHGTASFTRGKNRPAPPRTLTLCANDSFNTGPKLDAIYRFIDSLAQDAGSPSALLRLLGRQAPRLRGKAVGESVAPDAAVPAVTEAVRALDASHLVIQGPPGTGKTTTASKVIAALLADGQRVGVTSNSHAAINHLLKAAQQEALAARVRVRAAVAKAADDLPDGIDVIASADIDSAQHTLVGGTAWLFCRPEQKQAWDYLFVDEASQVSLADLVAVGACARNIVLLGDQMQLPQPTQGIHPGDSGLSALDFLMQGHATVAADKGVFLGQTYRMHPRVCAPVSEGIYEGRLASAEDCARQALVLSADADPALQPSGVVYVPVTHRNRGQSAPEEAVRIRTLYQSLLRQSWINRDGVLAAITPDDILVVAPYNAQVRELRAALGEGARVGTVDKFQGQEAAVAIVSMTTSDADNLPRSLDFLFSKNRLNVAVSRAKCLALIVASPSLQTLDCASVDDMPLLNFYSLLLDASAAGDALHAALSFPQAHGAKH